MRRGVPSPSTWQARKTKLAYCSSDMPASCACAGAGQSTPAQPSSPAEIRAQRRFVSCRVAAIKRWCRSGGEPVSARVFASDQMVTIASIASTSASAVAG